MSSNLSFTDAIKNRRTIYQLQKKSPISDARLQEVLSQIDEHEKFWDVVTGILKAIVPPESWEGTAGRMAGFRNAFGTILFYEDPKTVKELQEKVAAYADKVPGWSTETNAMHQYHAWVALENEGFGANLQHYNPLPNQKAAEIWNIPLEWQLQAQLVFGAPAEGARDSLQKREQHIPLEKRLIVHGA
ncbi:hypothetical protein AMS68_000276 [Peltaster fructicola]|uniref:Nitroreductase domain-containing protein n=1 Tax=Peltaster fructicola TaxID=286661 RepID=A0A6H0XJE6_9PEZI|nr:hypothetical protein AMS68_000276 [Peltaster fructicola]